MDDEDLGIEMDKMEAEQQGKKVDIDQTKVQKDIEAFVTLAKSGQRQPAIDGLLAIEKQGRLAEDITSTKLACRTILAVCPFIYAYRCLCGESLPNIFDQKVIQPPDHFIFPSDSPRGRRLEGSAGVYPASFKAPWSAQAGCAGNGQTMHGIF